ncbi:MAG: hypothetical protein RL217_342 [Pseudomonadota bacterium]|jgi:outer membrane protein
MKKLLSLTMALLAAGSAHAADLATIYQQALANDTEIAAATATREADGYNLTMARGALLPQASVSYNYSEFDMTIDAPAPMGKVDTKYDTKTLQLQASQTLFNLNSWYNYRAASAGNDSAELKLHMAQQQLVLRTAQAYFAVLRAQDNLSTALAEEKAVKRALEQTKQRFDVGLIAITDVHEAQAIYDLTSVNLLGREAALDISYEALEQLTGQRFDTVSPLQPKVAMEMPAPAKVEDWVQSGMDKYVGVLMAEAGLDAQRLQRNAARSNHMPTVQLFANYTDGEQYQFTMGDTVPAQTTVVGVQVSMPLLAGGSLYGKSKQAAQNYAAAELQTEKQRRDVKQNVRSLYRQVQTDVQNVKAREQSIVSAQSALEATETGYKVGTRNIVEVLNAQKTLYGAQRDYANARYDYILNLLNLKFFAGTLNDADIKALNAWLAQG